MASTALQNRPNTALEAMGHSVRFVAGVGLYRVARASAWAFGPTTWRHNYTTTLWYDKVIPELARFLGIIIRMYAEPSAPHHWPHFHAY